MDGYLRPQISCSYDQLCNKTPFFFLFLWDNFLYWNFRLKVYIFSSLTKNIYGETIMFRQHGDTLVNKAEMVPFLKDGTACLERQPSTVRQLHW